MTRRPSDGCKEAADALTLGGAHEMSAERARLHLKHCAVCRQDEQVVDELREAVLAVDGRLDDLTQARVQARLAAAMEQASREGEARFAAPDGRGLKLAMIVAAAAVVVVAAASMFWKTEAPRVPGQVKAVTATAPTPADNNSVLQPSAIINGAARWPGARKVRLGEKVARLQLPAGVDLKANLAQGAELSMYGPVDLAVKEADTSHTELNLKVGAMVVDYDAGKGKLLRIVSPGAITEVVGTLFSVEVQGGHTLVSVWRGKVNVRSGGATVEVTVEVLPGQTWSSEKRVLGQTPESSAALLRRHAGKNALSLAHVGEGLAPSRAQPKKRLGHKTTSQRAPREAPPRSRPPPIPGGDEPLPYREFKTSPHRHGSLRQGRTGPGPRGPGRRPGVLYKDPQATPQGSSG